MPTATRLPGPDAAPRVESVEAIGEVGFRLEPIAASGIRSAAPEALEALANGLADGETLRVVYTFRPRAHPSARLAVGLEGEITEARAEALRHAARIACPGFVPRAGAVEPAPSAQTLAMPAFNVTDLFTASPDAADLPAPRRHAPACAEPQLLLPTTKVDQKRLAATLSALDELEIDCALSIDVTALRLGAAEQRALASARRWLTARLATSDATGPEATLLPQALDVLSHWRHSLSGLSFRYVLCGREDGIRALAPAVTALLFGTADATARPADAVDLSLAVPTPGHMPALLAAPEVLALTGFRPERRRPAPGRDGLVLGGAPSGDPVAVPRADLGRHVYIIGATGTGKSTLIASMIRQDIADGFSFVLVDPHGDLFADVRADLPREAAGGVLTADVSDFDHPFSLNLLDVGGAHAAIQRNFVANQLISVFKRVLYSDVPEGFGPMFEMYFRNALFLLMETEGGDASLSELERVFGDRAYRKDLLERCPNETVTRFWKTIALRAGGDASLENIAPYICSKLTQFTGNPLVAPIISRPKSTLDMPKALADGTSVLVNLAKGSVGGPDAALLGNLIVIRLFAAAMARARLPRAQRRPVRVYLDEFQNYGAVLAEVLAECRKFGLELVLANQSLDQVEGRGANIAPAVLANAGSVLCFRVGPNDAHRLADWFSPEIDSAALQALPDRTAVARLLHGGRPCRPSMLATLTY